MTTYPELFLYINGEWRKTDHDLPVLNPATEEEIGRLPHAGRGDLDDALEAAERGFKIWSQVAPVDRANVLRRAAALMRKRQEQIATAITAEHGKPLTQARLEVIRGCEFLRVGRGRSHPHLRARHSERTRRSLHVVHHQPIGTVAAFSPWNFPMSQPCRKVAGAIAAGCSIILKAAEETPAGALHIAKALHDAGLPPGVLNSGVWDPFRDFRTLDQAGSGSPGGVYRLNCGRATAYHARGATHDAGVDGTGRPCAGHRLRRHRY